MSLYSNTAHSLNFTFKGYYVISKIFTDRKSHSSLVSSCVPSAMANDISLVCNLPAKDHFVRQLGVVHNCGVHVTVCLMLLVYPIF